MNEVFSQGGKGSTGILTNKQAVARHFGVKQSEVVYFSVGALLTGYKVIYDKATQRAYSLPSGIGSGVTAVSLSTAGVLVHSDGNVDLGALAVAREEYVTLPGSFDTGVIVNTKNELVVFADGKYRWDGELPKAVPADSTPDSTGEVKLGAWVSVGDAALRNQLAKISGPGIIGFDSAYDYPEGSAGSALAGAYVRTGHIFPVDQYGAVGDGVKDDTEAFEKAIAAAKSHGGGIIWMTPGKKYRTTWTIIFCSNLIFDGPGAEWYFDPIADGSAAFPDAYQAAGSFYTENVIFRNFKASTASDKGNFLGLPGARYVLIENLTTGYIYWHLVDGTNGKNVEIRGVNSTGVRSAVIQMESATYAKAAWGIDRNGKEFYPAFLADNSAYWSYADTWNVHDCVFNSGNTQQGNGVNLHGGVTMAHCNIHNNVFIKSSVGIKIDSGEKRYVRANNNYFINCNRGISSTGVLVGSQFNGNSFYNSSALANYYHIYAGVESDGYENLSDMPKQSLDVLENRCLSGGKTALYFKNFYGKLRVNDNLLTATTTAYWTSTNRPKPMGEEGGIVFSLISFVECNEVEVSGNNTSDTVSQAFISYYASNFSGNTRFIVKNNVNMYGPVFLVAKSTNGGSTIRVNGNDIRGSGSGSIYYSVITGFGDADFSHNSQRLTMTNSIGCIIADALNVNHTNNVIQPSSQYGTGVLFENCQDVITSNTAIRRLSGAGAFQIRAESSSALKCFEPYATVSVDSTSSASVAQISWS